MVLCYGACTADWEELAQKKGRIIAGEVNVRAWAEKQSGIVEISLKYTNVLGAYAATYNEYFQSAKALYAALVTDSVDAEVMVDSLNRRLALSGATSSSSSAYATRSSIDRHPRRTSRSPPRSAVTPKSCRSTMRRNSSRRSVPPPPASRPTFGFGSSSAASPTLARRPCRASY
jgi:hypothetical protein